METDIYVYGYNYYGQLGIIDNYNTIDKPYLLMNDINIKDIFCGEYYSFVYKKNGELWGFGRNQYGQLSIGNYNDQKTPILIMIDVSIISILCGNSHTLIHKKNGEIINADN